MNTHIEIHNHNVNEAGTYEVWYKVGKDTRKRILSEAYVNSLLDMDQKEKFFMGVYRFKINEFDFTEIVVNGEKRGGLN
jgi:hypothetical protein